MLIVNLGVLTSEISLMIKTLINKLNSFSQQLKRNFSTSRYYIVYKCSDGKTKTYMVGDIDLYKSFGNRNESRDNAGFKAYCFARKQVRSFRHDRIVSITKK